MKMVIGGAYQGQLAWAKENFPEIREEQWIDGKSCQLNDIYTCKGIFDFQEYIRRRMQAEDAGSLTGELTGRNPDIVIVSNEIGYGLVPVEEFERAYREQVGRTCTELAAFSDVVVRVVMGIGNYIKGKE